MNKGQSFIAALLLLTLSSGTLLASPLSEWLGKSLREIGHYEEDFLYKAASKQTKDPIGLWAGCNLLRANLPKKSAEVALLQAYCMLKVGMSKQALPHISQAILRAQKDTAPLILRAGYFKKIQMVNGLVSTLERCVKLDPENNALRHRLVLTYAKRRLADDRTKAFAHASVAGRKNISYARLYAKMFPQGPQHRYFLDKIAELKVDMSIGQLRTYRPTMAPRHFKISPKRKVGAVQPTGTVAPPPAASANNSNAKASISALAKQ